LKIDIPLQSRAITALVQKLLINQMTEEYVKNWYALYVKSKHEFVAHNELMKKDVETFLPACKVIIHV